MRRVLMVTPAYLPQLGGLELTVHALAKELLQRGLCHVEVAHIDIFSKTKVVETIDGVIVHRLPLVGWRLLGWASGLSKLVKGFDLLHVHDPQFIGISLNVIAQASGVPAVVSTHGGYWHTKRLALFKRLHQKFLLPLILNRYRLVLPSSESDQDDIQPYSDRLFLCPNGVDLQSFVHAKRTCSSLYRWIYWGRLASHKRIDLVVDVVRRLRESGVIVELTIGGVDFDGTLAVIKSLVQKHGLADQVTFLGEISHAELPAIASAHGVYVTASEHEGFGVAMVEALAAGLQVISRDAPPMNGLAANASGHLCLDFSDLDQAVVRIKEFLASELPSVDPSDEHRGQINTRFGWVGAVERFSNAYDIAIGR